MKQSSIDTSKLESVIYSPLFYQFMLGRSYDISPLIYGVFHVSLSLE